MNNNYNNRIIDNRFNTVYLPNHNIIPQANFSNNNQIVHNNIDNNVLDEYITEYTIYIQGIDRNFDNYPEPYNFRLLFNASGHGTTTNVDAFGNFSKTYYNGQPRPHIMMSFENVKHITICNMILSPSQTIREIEDEDDEYEIVYDDEYKLENIYRYLVLKIKDIGNNKILSTNDYFDHNSIKFYPSKRRGNFTIYKPIGVDHIEYPKGGLKNISNLQFEIFDDGGNLLMTKDINGNIINTKIIYDNISTQEKKDKFWFIHKALQVDIEMKLGVVDNNFNLNKY